MQKSNIITLAVILTIIAVIAEYSFQNGTLQSMFPEFFPPQPTTTIEGILSHLIGISTRASAS